MISGGLAVIAGVILFALAGWMWRGHAGHRTCPACHIPYELIASSTEDERTYDVLACPQCANTATLVHGARSHFAYCPACKNRSLQTSSVRAPGEGIAVEVRERCHLCEHQRTQVFGPVRPLGRVLPFPSEPRRPREKLG